MSAGSSHHLVVLVQALAIVQALRASLSPYLRGDGAAAEYLGFGDEQGRKFREWAEARRIPYSEVGASRTYRKRDLDRAWAKGAKHLEEVEGAY